MDLLARSTDEIISFVWKHSVSGCLSLFSSHLFALLCPRLPGISPTFTISSATKTCNNSNRRRKPNKYFSERLAKTHNPTDSNKSFAKLCGQIVMIVCIGLCFVIPIISPVCYNGISCHLNTFVKKGAVTGQIHSRHSHCKYHIYNCMRYESCCVKLLSLCVCLWMSIKGLLYSNIKQVNLSRCCKHYGFMQACCIPKIDPKNISEPTHQPPPPPLPSPRLLFRLLKSHSQYMG